MGEGKGHVFTLVQLLRWDDAVLFSVQVPGEAFHRDLTCTNTTQKFSVIIVNLFLLVLTETCTLKTSMKRLKPMMNSSDDMCCLCGRSLKGRSSTIEPFFLTKIYIQFEFELIPYTSCCHKFSLCTKCVLIQDLLLFDWSLLGTT